MVDHLHQLTAALYLLAALVAGLGLALRAPRFATAAVWVLGAATVAHGFSFATLHTSGQPPPLTELALAVSFMAWIGSLFFLFLARRSRLTGLVVLVAPLAFVSVLVAGLRAPQPAVAAAGGGSWEHAHVLLASAGLALLGLAGVAGVFFLVEHRRLKSKRSLSSRLPLPSLEALDRVNAVALGVGFPLLTLGVVSGAFWVRRETGSLWTGSPHELWSTLAWAIYALVVAARFTTRQGSRQAAAVSIGGFAFLFFAVIGLEVML